MVRLFFAGFLTKLLTGFDDVLTQIPLISYITKTKRGKIAFAIGMFCAIMVAIFIAFSFSSLVQLIPNYRIIFASLIFFMAFVVYFDVFKQRVIKTHKRMRIVKSISNNRFIGLMLVGFIAAFATVLDDIIVYSPLFVGSLADNGLAVAGILTASLLELTIIVYFSKRIGGLKFRKEFTTLALLILGLLIAFRII